MKEFSQFGEKPIDVLQVDYEEIGLVREVELKPNGGAIPVTEENKHEYVELVIKHKFVDSVAIQMTAYVHMRELNAYACTCIFIIYCYR